MNRKHLYTVLMPMISLSLSNSNLINNNNNNNNFNQVTIVEKNEALLNNNLNENNSRQSEEYSYSLDIINQGKYQRSLISRYPNVISKPNDFVDELDYFKEISKGDRNKWWGIEREVISFDIKTIGFESKEKFLLSYNQLNIDYNYGYNITNNGAKGWINGTEGAGIKTPIHATELIKLDQDKTIIVKEYSWAHHSSSYHKVKLTLSFSWINSTTFKLSFFSKASLDYNSWSNYDHAAYTGFKFNYATIS